VSSNEDKTEKQPFDTTQVIEEESESVLNTITEHDFHNASKRMAQALGTVHKRG
jgi:hypothetical protein